MSEEYKYIESVRKLDPGILFDKDGRFIGEKVQKPEVCGMNYENFKFVLASSPQDAFWVFTEKEKCFQKKYGLQTGQLVKIISIEISVNDLTPIHLDDPNEDLYFWKINYDFRRASL